MLYRQQAQCIQCIVLHVEHTERMTRHLPDRSCDAHACGSTYKAALHATDPRVRGLGDVLALAVLEEATARRALTREMSRLSIGTEVHLPQHSTGHGVRQCEAACEAVNSHRSATVLLCIMRLRCNSQHEACSMPQGAPFRRGKCFSAARGWPNGQVRTCAQRARKREPCASWQRRASTHAKGGQAASLLQLGCLVLSKTDAKSSEWAGKWSGRLRVVQPIGAGPSADWRRGLAVGQGA